MGSGLACISLQLTAEARDTTAMTSLRLLAVLDVLFKAGTSMGLRVEAAGLSGGFSDQ